MQNIDPKIRSAIEKLSREVPRVLLVGGYVRDLLLGKHPKDADVEAYGIDAVTLKGILEKLFGRVDVMGESFGIYKVIVDDYELDVSIPRRESKSGRGHKGFVIEGDPSMTVSEAMRRRDFTVNAMGLDPNTGELIDPYDGRGDLEKRVLKVVDEKTFQDDPLRVFRAVQFAARFDFAVEEKSFALMKTMVERGDLGELSKERVTDEWKKLLLKAERPSVGFALMRDLGIVDKHYPELKALIGVPQEAEWHPEGDVWTHTLMTIDESARIIRDQRKGFSEEEKLQIMVGTICHDLGKPISTKKIDGRWRSFGHEESGVEPTKSFSRRFTFGQDLERVVVMTTREHLKPSAHYRAFQRGELAEMQYVNAIRRLLKRLRDVPLEVYLAVTESDVRGRGHEPHRGEYAPGDFMRAMINKYHLEEAAKELLISGQELIDEFGLKEGPALGAMLDAVEDARDEGEISTKEEAREFVYNKLNS